MGKFEKITMGAFAAIFMAMAVGCIAAVIVTGLWHPLIFTVPFFITSRTLTNELKKDKNQNNEKGNS